MKFTERGEVLIEIDRWSQTGQEVELHFSVKDTGIGIPLSKQEDVFTAFAQADGSSTRNFGGTGLGLTISSQLVGMMGGRIWLESELGAGSTFHFTARLGIAPARSLNTPAAEPHADFALLAGLSVLVVDDNDTNRRILGRILSRRGLRVTMADSGPAALASLRDAAQSGNPFTLAILDIQMPGMDGFTLTQRIKADPQFSATNIALLASSIQRGDTDRCRDLGVSAYLVKPVGEIELLEAIARMSHITSDMASPDAPPPRYPLEEAGPRLRLLVVDDNPVNRLVAKRMLENRHHIVKEAANGLEALDMIEKETFDCLLMDAQMPIIDGFEATAAIRKRERDSGGHLPIIATTAHAMSGDRERCLAAGMDGYLSKPLNPKDVFATIDSVLSELKTNSQSPDFKEPRAVP
jgi:two-component system, sensor histidine kinase and response regulator